MKRLLVVSGVLAGLLLALLLILPGVIDWNPYKTQISARIGAAIGRTVTLDGDIRMTLLPSPAFSVGAARIANPAGFTGPDMARVKRLDVAVAFWPLLEGRVQVERVALVEPELVYEIKAGGGNWTMPADGASALADSFSFDRILVRGGRLTIRDDRVGDERVIERIDADVTAGSLAGPFSVTGTFAASGVDVHGELTTGRFSGGSPVPLRVVLGLAGDSATLRLTGIVARNGARTRCQGDLRVDGGDAASALTKVFGGIAPPAFWPILGPRPFSFKASLDADDQHVQLGNAELQLGDGRATGAIVFTPGSIPDFSVTLATNRLDLDAWAGTRFPSVAGVIPGGVSATLAFSADAMTLAGGLLRQVRVEAQLDQGTLHLDRVSALLPGGADIAAAGAITPGEDGPRLDLRVEGNADNLRALSDWARIDVKAIAPDRLRKAEIKAHVVGTPDQITATDMDVLLDTTRVTGAMSYADRGGRPAFGVQLDLDRLNSDLYLDAPIALAAVRRLVSQADFNLRLSAGSLTLAGVPIQGMQLDAAAVDGVVDVDRLDMADIAGITATVSGRLPGAEASDPGDLTFSASGDSLAGLSRYVAWPSAFPSPDAIGRFEARGRVVGPMDTVTAEVHLSAAGATMDAAGPVDHLTTLPHVAIKARLQAADGGAVLARLAGPGVWLPPFGPVDVYASVEGTSGAFVIDDLAANIGTATVKGRVDVDLSGDRPRFDGKVRSGDLNLAVPPSGDPAWSRALTDLGWLGAVDGRLTLSAASIQGLGERLDTPAMTLRLDGGHVRLEQLDGGWNGGRLGATGDLVIRGGDLPSLRLSVRLSNAHPQNLQLPGGLALVADGFDLSLDVDGDGPSLAGMLQGLTGSGWVAARTGRLTGVDLGTVGRERRLAAGGETALSAVGGSLKVARGVARLTDGRVSGPECDAAVEGSFSLPDDALDLRLSITGPTNADDPTVLVINGPIERPTIHLATAADAGAGTARDGIGALIESLSPAEARPPVAGKNPP